MDCHDPYDVVLCHLTYYHLYVSPCIHLYLYCPDYRQGVDLPACLDLVSTLLRRRCPFQFVKAIIVLTILIYNRFAFNNKITSEQNNCYIILKNKHDAK